MSFAQASLIQSAQNHGVQRDAEPRLCRWLLMTGDRLGSEILPVTQRHLSIGVQRTTVTAIASALQARGVVAYSRGKIRITDTVAIFRDRLRMLHINRPRGRFYYDLSQGDGDAVAWADDLAGRAVGLP